MGRVFSVDQAGDGARIAAELSGLDLKGPPSVDIVIAGAGNHGLLPALREAVQADRRVVVVATQPLDECDLGPVIELADDLLDWDDTTVDAVAARLDRWRAIAGVLASPEVAAIALGHSPAHRDTLAQVVELARYSDAPVLVTGETGTGKEVTARLIHALGERRKGSFVVVDCTTLLPTLSGSELFGHERGAFTGAVSTRTGACAAADGGTLFLDEVGELPGTVQAELLRVIQEGTYKRIGGDRWLKSRFRLVCATNRDLGQEMLAGRFRPDLYHRISAGTVELRPLRDRREDIAGLFSHFLGQALGTAEPPEVTEPVLRMLQARAYPGNLRDLRHVAIRVAARHPGRGRITLGHLARNDRTPPGSDCPEADPPAAAAEPADDFGSSAPPDAGGDPVQGVVRRLLDDGYSLREITKLVSDRAVDVALEAANGSTKAAAAILGMTERAVQLRRAAGRTDVAPEPT